MKRIVILVVLLKAFSLIAQNYHPTVVATPVTGFMQLQRDNPYILSLVTDGSDWLPSMRYIRETAPNIAYLGTNITSSWHEDKWSDLEFTTDSFILDNQNRLSVIFNKRSLNYPGYTSESKSKYMYHYNASNQLERFEHFDATSFTSNNYKKTSVSYFTYDATGKQILDSNIYYYTGGSQTSVSHFSYTGDKLKTVTLMYGADTTRVTHYTFSGELLTLAIGWDFDANTDEWILTYADTFDYNTMGQVIRRSSLGYVYRDGVVTLEPVRNDSYTYTSNHQLKEEIERQWVDGAWVDFTKTIITYGANNKPTEGFEYTYDGTDWSTTPRTKYLFAVQTGLSSVSNDLSEITIAPNPANDIITIDLYKHAANLKVFDITGKSVYEQTGVNGKHQIDVSALNNGVYYASIQSEGLQRTAKIVVSH